MGAGEDGLGMQTDGEFNNKLSAGPPVNALRYSKYCVPDETVICEDNSKSGWHRVKFNVNDTPLEDDESYFLGAFLCKKTKNKEWFK